MSASRALVPDVSSNDDACGAERLLDSAARGRLPDPSNAFNKTAPLHRWTPWTAGFSAAFVAACLDLFPEAGRRGRGVVLDPFAGVGTTLVEAARQGRRAVGFEINPYAALSARAKLRAGSLDPRRIEEALLDCLRHDRRRTGSDRCPPEHFRTKVPFFPPRTLERALAFLDWLEGVDDGDLADLFRVAFGAVMVGLSNYVYGPSLCVAPGGRRARERDLADVLTAKVRSMAEDVESVRSDRERRPGDDTGVLHLRDYLDSAGLIEPGSVDLIVTSPPYPNNYDYVRNTRPQLHWLSLADSPERIREIEAAQFGGRWQDVRGAAPVGLEFRQPGLERLLRTLAAADSESRLHSGRGWANYVAGYFNAWRRLLLRFGSDLRQDGTALVVIGNSIIRGIDIPVAGIVGDMAGLLRLHCSGSRILRRRVRAPRGKVVLLEEVVAFRLDRRSRVRRHGI